MKKRIIALCLVVVLVLSIVLTQWITARYATASDKKLQTKVNELIESCNQKIDLQNYDGALEDMNLAIELDDSNSALYVMRASIYSSLNNSEYAIEDYKKALEINPDLTTLFEKIAYLYYDMKDFDHAVTYINKALEYDKNNVELIKTSLSIHDTNKDYENALTDINRLISLSPQDAALYCSAADYNVYLKNYKEAISYYETAINYYNEVVDSATISAIYSALGSCYVQLEDYANAIIYFTKHIDSSNDSTVESIYNRGVAYFYIEDYESAIKDFNTAINSGYNIDACRLQRGICNYNLEYYADALTDLIYYLNSYPDDTQYWIYLARCYYFTGNSDVAQIWFEKCDNANISYAESCYFLADICLNKKDYTTAISYYTSCIKENYSVDISYYNRGICYLNLSDYDKAKTDFENAAAITTDDTMQAEIQNILSQYN